MGLFNRNASEANFAGGRKNVLESIQREYDTNTLIYLDPRVDFNTNSVITVAPNEQVIFIKNGEFYGTLPSGRHEVKSENYPFLSRLRNIFTGGVSTFTCQVYHISTNEQNVSWGTSSAIEIQDFFLGGGVIGVPTLIRGAGEFRVRFNIKEDDDAAKRTFMRLMGDKSAYTTSDLSMLFRAQISQEISDVVGKTLEERSLQRSINAISSQLKDFSRELNPRFEELFSDYGLELMNFSFYNLTIDETYDKAVQQELLKDVAVNPGSGSIANTGAGIGMGMAAGGAFGALAQSAFSQNHNQMTFNNAPQQADPMETLTKMKKMLDAGLISQEIYDAKVAEIMSRL